MAQVNITLSAEEVLQVMSENRDEAFKLLMKKILDELLLAESEDVLHAGRYERSEERTDSRNGTRERPLVTRIGSITLNVPRHRNVPFHTMLFDNYQRSEAALITTMIEMVINGVSTRKIEKVTETLCGEKFSKSTVSEMCKRLDEEITLFRNRDIDPEKYPFLMVDATYFRTRVEHRIVSSAFFVAIGIDRNGRREVLGFNVYDCESNETWLDFMSSLKKRGLTDVKMITSDAHKAILNAITKVYPDTPWQRCQFHFTKNITETMPEKYREGIRAELGKMYNAKTLEEARRLKEEIVDDYKDVAEKAMDILENGFEDAMTVMILPEAFRKQLRTSNVIERLNRELKRRSNVINIFPNRESVLRLMGQVTIEYNDVLSVQTKRFFKAGWEEYIELKSEVHLKELAHTQQTLLQAA